MLTIKTATLESDELSEELDDASLQVITGGVYGSLGVGAALSVLNGLLSVGGSLSVGLGT